MEMMHHVCSILATGAERPMAHMKTLDELFEKFHELFVKLCGPNCKPKVHHMHHITDAMEWVGRCLSCLVTERKHRQVKDTAPHVFRRMEHTVLVDVVNKQCEQILSGHDLFERIFLIEPRQCKLQKDIHLREPC